MRNYQAVVMALLVLLVVTMGCAPTATPTVPVPTGTPTFTSTATTVPTATATPTPTVPAATVTPTRTPTARPPSAIITSPMTGKPGDWEHSLVIDGQARVFFVYVPLSYDGKRLVPLVLMLHGRGMSAKPFSNATGMSAAADREGFIVVCPQAIGTPPTWNLGFIKYTGQPDVDDVAFIRVLIQKMQQELAIDAKRIYVGGYSTGAMMSYRLGAELADTLAAIGSVGGTAGALQRDGSKKTVPAPSQPMPVIAIHGKQDNAVPYDGYQGSPFFSVAESIAFWVQSNGCAVPQKETFADGNVIKETYGGCKNNADIVLYTVVDGGHDWFKSLGRRAGASQDLTAAEALWEFFAQHPKR